MRLSSRRDTTWSITDNLSWTHGKHGLKFGFEYRNLYNQVGDYGLSRGFVYSSNIGEFTSDSNTCNAGGCTPEAFNWPTFDFAQKQFQGYEGQVSAPTPILSTVRTPGASIPALDPNPRRSL